MKNLSKTFSLLFILVSSLVYCQNTTNTFLKTSTAIEPNSIFIPSKTVKDLNFELFNNQNFNTFYLIKTIESKATKTFYSFDIASNKDKDFIIKTIYDSDNAIISIYVSSYDSNKLKLKIIGTTDLARVAAGCNRYNYSLEGCWNALLDWLSN